ncbi:integrase (plasmid) [Mycobacterium dioxanotrophicus]|uniref:Integrase n=2 Tax=Mycobacteriaceae TaxID=1762 RepID=A0A1Y0CHB6_9MYCO|nr:integrase [Mycobacterium dioxanotrophicus]
MTAPEINGPGLRGLLGRLMAVVRPEFRSDVLEFPADDLVFGGGACRVPGCQRSARGHGFCQGHGQRWVDAGRPDPEVFAATTDPRWRRQQPNQRCAVDGCGYGTARGGLCSMHARRWEHAGRPDRDRWLAAVPAVKQPAAGAVCRIEHCLLWPQASSPFCHAHTNAWRCHGRPDPGEFADGFVPTGLPANETIRLGTLAPALRLEMQYALQCRHDQRRGKVTPTIVGRVVRLLVAAEVSSLLDHDEAGWRQLSGQLDSNARGLLMFAHRVVADLAEDDGWDGEYDRDVWRMHRLGFDGHRSLRFTSITQPWLQELAKRFVRLRLSRGLGLEAGGGRPVLAITRFSAFLSRTGVERIDQLDRPLLEHYLADLSELSIERRRSHIGTLNGLFTAIRQHHWHSGLAATVTFYNEDYPHRAELLPRALAEQVMTQLEHPANLDRFDNRTYRLITIVLMRSGLRVTDALRLRADCITTDAEGAPYLRYFNHKMRRDALVPIDAELVDQINEHRRRTLDRWPGGTPILFPRPTKNVDGTQPLGTPTYRAALLRGLAACDIRDDTGQPVHLTPHRWRHTLGTRLINRDVPQEVVRRILDHDSPQMTAHYARMHDTTVRRAWEAARKVDITGRTVVFDPDGPLADAAWAKQRLAQATQALPNGYCGLPLQQSCPHANACLTCSMFLTTAEFLPQHRTQRQQTLELITAAEARGQKRLAEMNRTVLTNLDTIIDSLDTSQDTEHAL